VTTELARLGIGTAQWGVAYGVNNSIGIAHKDDINMMLAFAAKNSLIIDTAWTYGNSEEKIGSMLDHNSVKIVTKTKPIKTCSSQLNNQAQQVVDAVLTSISLLGGHQLYGVLVHQSNDLLGPHGNRLWRMLKQLKSKGLIEKVETLCRGTS
jgi:aryl-alcohol dehydrogenase-like predicted oxidoreductase